VPKKLFRFYQLYTIIASTVIFLASLLLLSGPVRTANLIIVAPLTALSWLNLTNPQKTSEAVWSLRVVIVVFCLTVLGLITFQLSFWLKPVQPDCPDCSTAAVAPSPTLAIDPELLVLPDIQPSPTPQFTLGTITISHQAANIYSQPNLNSQIIDIATTGETFPSLEFAADFFKIQLNSTQSGWVRLADVVP